MGEAIEMEEMWEIASPERLKALYKRYPITGALVIGSDVCFIHAYDKDGNELVLKAQAEEIQYQEILVAKQKE